MTIGTMLFLYAQSGDAPRAFQCKLTNWGKGGHKSGTLCGFVTKTKRGMQQHQRLSHNFKPQQDLFVKKEQTAECCAAAAPEFSGSRQDGETYTCCVCKEKWQWVTDEATGSCWRNVMDL